MAQRANLGGKKRGLKVKGFVGDSRMEGKRGKRIKARRGRGRGRGRRRREYGCVKVRRKGSRGSHGIGERERECD